MGWKPVQVLVQVNARFTWDAWIQDGGAAGTRPTIRLLPSDNCYLAYRLRPEILPGFFFFSQKSSEPERKSLKHNCKLNLRRKHLLGVCTQGDGARVSDSVTECGGIPAPLTGIFIYRVAMFTYAHNPARVCVCGGVWVCV